MGDMVKKLLLIDSEDFVKLEEICRATKVPVNVYIRQIISNHLNHERDRHLELMSELQELRNLVKEGVELSAASIAAFLVFNDDAKLTPAEATEKSRKLLVDSLKLKPAIRRHNKEV